MTKEITVWMGLLFMAVPTVPFALDVKAGGKIFSNACAACHGVNGEGMAIFPKLAGNSVRDTVAKLRKYRAGEEVGSNSALMIPMAKALSDQDIDNLAAYINSLRPSAGAAN